MAKTYTYAVVPTQGCYGSGSRVRPALRTNDLATARKAAAKFTRQYKAAMKPCGGSGGGYRVVEWGHSDETRLGWELDRYPTV